MTEAMLQTVLALSASTFAGSLAHGGNLFDELIFTGIPLLLFAGLLIYYRFFAKRPPDEPDEDASGFRPAESDPETDGEGSSTPLSGTSDGARPDGTPRDRAQER